MTHYPEVTSKAAVTLQEVHQQLDALLARLDEVNERCVSAAKPLDRLAELNFEQRRDVAERIRAANAEWDSVTLLIAEALARLR